MKQDKDTHPLWGWNDVYGGSEIATDSHATLGFETEEEIEETQFLWGWNRVHRGRDSQELPNVHGILNDVEGGNNVHESWFFGAKEKKKRSVLGGYGNPSSLLLGEVVSKAGQIKGKIVYLGGYAAGMCVCHVLSI